LVYIAFGGAMPFGSVADPIGSVDGSVDFGENPYTKVTK